MCNTCGCKKAESFEAEAPRILNIKKVKYVGDSIDIKIELEQGDKKHMYQGVLNKGSGCDKCGSEVMAQWERKGQIMDLCKECYLMHFYNAEESEAPDEIIEIDGYNPLRAERYMDMVLFYVGDRADLRYKHDGKGRPTTERQLLGNSPNYKSIINPLGITMNDIDIVMNSGLSETRQKPWDGKYILFEESGTFTTGKPVNYFDSTIEYGAEFYSSEDFNAETDEFGDIEDHSDVWTPEREVIEQIKNSRRLMEEFPMISYDSRWNPTKVNEWSPERQTIDEIRGNPMYEEEFSYLGRHPGYYDRNGFWVEKMNPEMFEDYSDIQVPLLAQVGLTIAVMTGATFILKKLSK